MEIRSDDVDGRLRSTTSVNAKARDYGRHIFIHPEPVDHASLLDEFSTHIAIAEPTYRHVIQLTLDQDILSERLAQNVIHLDSNCPESFLFTAHLASEEDVRVTFLNDVAA